MDETNHGIHDRFDPATAWYYHTSVEGNHGRARRTAEDLGTFYG